MPRVSVLMAVYNGERYLQEAIDSILAQTFRDFEFVIVDDGSSDSTAAICADYARQDARIVFIQNAENIGLTRALNQGLAVCTGDCIARMDGDDISLPPRLAEQLAYLDAHPDAVLVSGHYHLINEVGDIFGTLTRDPALVDWGMLFYNYIGGHGQVMFRRVTVLEVGGYNEKFPYSQDYELWLRLRSKGRIVLLPKVWSKIRIHTENISATRRDEQEKLSLELSQAAIKQFSGQLLSLEGVASLRHFWLEPFPDSRFSPILHKILQTFAIILSKIDRQLSQLVVYQIENQFGKWLRSISLRRSPRQKLQVARYWLRWKLHRLGSEVKNARR